MTARSTRHGSRRQRRHHPTGVVPPLLANSSAPLLATRVAQATQGGGAGNRTRVLRRFARASPSAARYASTRPLRSRERVGVTGPVAINLTARAPRQDSVGQPPS